MRKKAVTAIEEAFRRHKKRDKMRTFRKYLHGIPYESRILFMKFENGKIGTDSMPKGKKGPV